MKINPLHISFVFDDFARSLVELIEFNKRVEKDIINNEKETLHCKEHSSIFGKKFDIIGEIDLKNSFTKTLQNNNLITIISLFEYSLIRLCEIMSVNSNQKISNFKGSELERSIKFIKANFTFDSNKISNEWQFINNAKILRNILTHQKGIIIDRTDDEKIDKKFRTIKQFITQNPNLIEKGLEQQKRFLIKPKKEFNQKLIENIFKFYEKLENM